MGEKNWNLEEHRKRVENEFLSYYSTFDPFTQPLMEKMNQLAEECEGLSSFEKKTRTYELLCRECPVHLFRESDFIFEISSGRTRYTWGGFQSPVGAFWQDRTAPLWLNIYGQELEEDRREGFLHGWNNPVGFDHHCPGYDKLLSMGLNGIIAEAEGYLTECTDPRKKEFYQCVIRANRALIHLAERFRKEALRLAGAFDAATEEAGNAGNGTGMEPGLREHYEKMADALEQIPANPPRTFYEGLCMIVFYRECVGSLEGIGFSTWGQLDRMLYPLYRADLEAGRVTGEEALRLFCDLLLYTDCRFNTKEVYQETSTTIQLGGCDRAGNVIYNDLTDLILSAVMNIRSIGTKINCRISRRHPEAYLGKIAGVQLSNLPTLMMQNDEVLVAARVRQGQDEEDARMYVGGGCHEIVLQGTEVCTRADTWISLPRILLESMKTGASCGTFEEFYQKWLADAFAYYQKIADLKNKGEAHWCECAPTILYSSTLKGCLEKGMDMTEGGAKYNSTAVSMLGTATLIDSLYAIRRMVYEDRRFTLEEFLRIAENNFAGEEALRKEIINTLPKHGTNDEELNAFSVRVLSDLSGIAGQKNARGGTYLPAFYPHDAFRTLGEITGATPDGRAANMPLSRGVSPSEFVQTDSPIDLINSLKPIDFTEYADSFCAELTLPRMEYSENTAQIIVGIIKAFLDAEGSSLQINMLDRQMLQEAQKHPEDWRNLCVRVCGYSAVFVSLDKSTQDEVIARVIR